MPEADKHKAPPLPLWTRDFTIITLGSAVSMLGGQLAGFAMSLLVLDYTGSTFYFAMYNIAYFLPYVAMPLIAGPFLDRFSRKRAIYTLDYITAGLYLLFTAAMKAGVMGFSLLALGTFLLGVIGSVYQVAYESFYPLLIPEGNYSKAYSVASTLETLTVLMVPIATFIYKNVGITPLFAVNVVTFAIAATVETRISQKEDYIEKRAEEDAGKEAAAGFKKFMEDFREGMAYLYSEKGLLAVALYFLFSMLFNGVGQSVTLPYFKQAFSDGEYMFMLVWGANAAARALGGMFHYSHKLPTGRKYDIALSVYICISLIGAFYLYFPLPVMMVLFACDGLLGITSYNIRISATQRYVPDEKKGRFNGAFNTLSMLGMLLGQFTAGVLSIYLPIRAIVTIFGVITLGAALFFIAGNRDEVKKIYNTQD